MPPYTFLSALPALLGLAGFVLYQILVANKSGGEISRRIIEKLRSGLVGEVSPDQRLTPKQVERLLEQERRLRELVGEKEFQLLKQALRQQFHELRGSRKGTWAVTMSGNWRVTFTCIGKDVDRVDYQDYY